MSDRRWLVALLTCAALLVVPLGSWLAVSLLGPPPPAPKPAALEVPRGTAGSPMRSPEPVVQEKTGPGYRAVEGTVNGSDGSPLSGAKVWVEGVRGVSTRTATNGHFRLGGVPVAAQVVRASAAGHLSGRASVAKGAGGSVAQITIQLKKAPPVRGRVLTPDGYAAAGAMVRCVGVVDGEAITGQSDDDGNFELAPAADGCDVVADLQGYGSSESAKAVSGKDLTLRLRSLGSIAGIVEDGDRLAVPGAQVSVEVFNPAVDGASATVRRQATTDGEGRFVLPDLQAGRYLLTARREGAPPTQSDPIELDSGEQKTGVRITLGDGGVATGRITDAEDRSPIADAVVSLDAMAFSGGQARSVRTDENGNYRMQGVPENSPFSLRVQAQGYNVRVVAGLEARGGEASKDVALNVADGRPRREVPSVGFKVRSTREGLRVVQVSAGGPGEKAGLQTMDIITSLDGTPTSAMAQVEAIQRLRGEPGTRVSVVVQRDGAEKTFSVERELLVR